MKLTANMKMIAACFSILTMLSQSVYALSAPCPMMSDLMNDSMGRSMMNHSMDHSDMNHASMDHSMMDQSSDHMNNQLADMEADSCCGEDSCPMNTCGSAVLYNAGIMKSSNIADHAYEIHYSSHYNSVQSNNLYRPPISL